MFNVRRVSVGRLSFSTERGGLGKGHPVGTAGWTPSPARGRQRALGTQRPGGGGAAQMRRRRRTRGPASARAGVDVSQWRRVSARRGRREGGRAGAQGPEPLGWRAGWGCEASGALGFAWPGKTLRRLAPPRSPPRPLSCLGRAGCPGRPGPQQASRARSGAAGQAWGPAGSPGSPDASAEPGRGPTREMFPPGSAPDRPF